MAYTTKSHLQEVCVEWEEKEGKNKGEEPKKMTKKDKTVFLFDVATGKEIRPFTGHTNIVNSVVFSPDGRLALSGSDDKTLRLWDVATGTEK